MFEKSRPSRRTVLTLAYLGLLLLIAGLAATAAPGAGARFGFIDQVGEFFGLRIASSPQVHIGKESMFAGPVTVAGSTGANGDYATLKAAFDAINLNGTQGGN